MHKMTIANMQMKIIGDVNAWRYSGITIVLLYLSFSPYLFFDFAFHNDFEIWTYDNKACCSGFTETQHLISIGRFLQAYLQGMYLWFFTDLESLAIGRAFGIAFACIGAILLSSAGRKNGMGALSSAAFGATVFMLPPAQVNLGWITNFVPGLFNAVLVLYAASIFPDLQSILSTDKSAQMRLGACAILLLATLFIYPPTIGFFLLPLMIRIMYSGFAKREDWLHAAYAFIFFMLICTGYFLMHRFVFMKMFGITFQPTEFYRFDLAMELRENFTKFFFEIVPVMLNLWNPAPLPVIAASVLFLIATPAAVVFYQDCRTSPLRAVLPRSTGITLVLLLLFLAINTPGLLAIGRPPSFYRAWHPGMASVLLLLFHGVEFVSQRVVKKCIIVAFLLTGCFFSFDSSMHLATTLSKQFEYAVAQIGAQFSPPDRDRYILIEKRQNSLLFGRPRWGELGFVHILSRGHGSYILKQYFDYGIVPSIESIVVKQNSNSVLLEPELLEKSSQLFPRSPADPLNKPFDRAFDFRADTFFEQSGLGLTVVDSVGTRPASIACYKIHAGVDGSPSRAPRSWRFTGSNDGNAWAVLDSQSNQTAWHAGESRLFRPVQAGSYKHYRLEVDSSNQPGIVRISEMQLFTRISACQDHKLAQKERVDPSLLKSLTSMPDAMSVELAGIAVESGLSDPPFRLQRALDNIYYTFWETPGLFPIDVDIRFFESRKIQCYALQAGDDKTHDRMPRSWKFMGSNDGNNWNVLDIRDGELNWTDSSRRIYSVAAPGSYRSYRIEFLAINGGSHLRLYEMALSEDRECTHTIP